jgi:hypothetical protein
MSSGAAPSRRHSRRGFEKRLLASFSPVSSVTTRRGEPQKRLQEPVEIGRGLEILAADHMRDALDGVVQHDGEMIARRHVLADEDGVAPSRRIAGDVRFAPLRVEQRPDDGSAGGRERAIHGEALRMGSLGGGHATTAGSRIERGSVGIARRERTDGGGQLSAGAGAAEEKAPLAEPRCRGPVIVEMLRLPPRLPVEADPQPVEILPDRGDEFGPRPPHVDVLDAQQQAAVETCRKLLVQQRRKGVAEMEQAVGARREAEDGLQDGLARVQAFGRLRSSGRRRRAPKAASSV